MGKPLENLRSGRRWSDVVLIVTQSHTDIRTVEQWADSAGMSQACLRSICTKQGTLPKESLTFARLLRLAVQQQLPMADELIEADDPRTTKAMLNRAGLPRIGNHPQNLTAAEFLKVQCG